MTARDTYAASVAAATATQAASDFNAEQNRQTTIDGSKGVVGYNLQTGNFAALNSATISANIAKAAARQLAEMVKQEAINHAKQTLRATGDLFQRRHPTTRIPEAPAGQVGASFHK